jgi:gluconate kinase
MPASLIESQVATLEPPSADEGALICVPPSVAMTPVAAVASFVCDRLAER